MFLGLLLSGYFSLLMNGEPESRQLEKIKLTNFNHQLTQQWRVDEALSESRWYLDSLSKQLGQVQARMLRLEALGERLIEVSSIGEGEFDFGEPPAMGGPEHINGEQVTYKEIMLDLQQLSSQLDDRAQQLGVMDQLIREESVSAELFPRGRPVLQGWLSSPYGYRADPFSGQREFHAGVDFAGKEGSEVLAVASGIVSWSGSKKGYGQLVEVDHGKGYVTRYGHNKELLVVVGDLVEKGQALALMGSTGRATGTHLHFEIVQNGKTTNPANYLSPSKSH